MRTTKFQEIQVKLYIAWFTSTLVNESVVKNLYLLTHEVNHGYGGDLRIEAPDYTGTAAEFIRAGQEFGYPNRDLNAPFTEGFDVLRYPIKGGRRQSSYKAFIEPIRTLPNLTIMKFAHVNKVSQRREITVHLRFISPIVLMLKFDKVIPGHFFITDTFQKQQ